MRNVFLKAIMSVALVSLLALGSCAKQRNVTDDLEARVKSLETTVASLKQKVDQGKFVKSLTADGNKVTIELSDGTKHDVLGYSEAAATVWTIGKDGYWYKNDKKTEFKAVGTDGAKGDKGEKGETGAKGEKGEKGEQGPAGPAGPKGEDGKSTGEKGAKGDKGEKGDTGAPGAPGEKGPQGDPGKAGTNGLNGSYYVLNEDGFFYLVEWELKEDGTQEKKEPVKTEFRWKPESSESALTVAYDGNILIISGAKGADGDIQIALVTLNNLFILPDNVGATSKHPLIVLRPFTIGDQPYDPGADPDVCPVSEKCDAIKLEGETWVRYRVSPASVTEAMIDMDNIRFEAHQSNLRSNDGFTVKDAVLKDGILSVLVGYDLETVDKLNTWGLIEDVPTAGTSQGQMIEQLMLVVPTKSGNEKEVYSDWAQVVQQPAEFEDYKGYTATSILLNQYYNRPLKKLYNSVANAKAGDAIASIPYGTPTELKKLVGLYDKDNKLKLYLAEYDLEFQFDLLDEEGKPFEYKVPADNNTDQQRFVKIKDGIITPQSLAGKELDQSSTGRTPIVRVTVHYKGENYACNPLSTYFIKLEITKKKTSESKTVAYKFEKPITNICKDYVGNDALVFNTTEVNKKILEDLGLTAAEFQKEFDFDSYANEKTKTRNPLVVGTVTTDPATSAPQGTVNVFWSINAGEITPIHYGKTITKTAIYRSKTGTQEISIVLSVDVKEPIIKATDIFNATWKTDENGYPTAQHTPGTPGIDPAKAVYPTNVIYQAFKNDKAKPVPDIVFPEALGKFTYKFQFARHQQFKGIEETITEGADKGKTRTVEVYVDKGEYDKLKAVEKINGEAKGAPEVIAMLTDKGAITPNLTAANPLAQELLNYGADFLKAKVELKVELKVENNCAGPVRVEGFGGPCGDQFIVKYTRPINHEDTATEHAFWANSGSNYTKNYIHAEDILKLTSWNGDRFVVDENAADKANSFEFWDVTKITFDLDKVTTNPASVGVVPELVMAEKSNDDYKYTRTIINPDYDNNKPETPANSKTLPDPVYEGYKAVMDNKPFLQYKHSGAVGTDFELIIPVTIEYKFGKITSTVKIPVKKEDPYKK